MTDLMNRRDLLKLAGMGVAVFVSGTTVRGGGLEQKNDDSFYFVQLSDTHWVLTDRTSTQTLKGR